MRGAYRKDVLSGILFAVTFGLTGPFFAVIAREQLRASALEISIITMAPVAGGVLSIIWVSLMAGRPKMPFATWAWIVGRALLIAMLFANTAHSFVAIIAMFWVICSIAGPAYSALMKEIYPDGDRGRLMGYARVGIMFAMIIVSGIAGPLLHLVSYRYVFPIAGLFGIASALVFNAIPVSDDSGDSNLSMGELTRSAFQILKEDGGFRWFCAGTFISGGALYMILPISAIFQVDVLGVDTRWAGIYSVLTQAVATYGYFYWGHHVDRKKPVEVVAINALFLGLVPLFYCVSSQAWMLLPAMALMGWVSSGLDLSYFTGILHYAPDDQITHYQAIFASLLAIRGIVGPVVGAALVDGHVMSMKQLFLAAAALVLFSYIVQVAGIRNYDVPTDRVGK